MFARRRACAWSLEREPATGCRLCRRGPASDALSPRRPVGQEARPGRLHGLITRARSRPHAVRRLLPSIRSASTVVGPSIPTVGGARLSPELRRAVGLRWLLVHPRVSGAARGPQSRVFLGQGLVLAASSRSLPEHPRTAMARSGGFAPTRSELGHLMSRWPRPAWLESPYRKNAVRRRTRRIFSWVRPRPLACADCRGRVASLASSRKGTRSAAPEVPSVPENSIAEVAHSRALSGSRGWVSASSISAGIRARTVRWR